MTKEERHNFIINHLIQCNSASVNDLAEKLQVSSVTIRKDLSKLEKASKLYRSHGKAILINPYLIDRNLDEKQKLCIEEKRSIGREAAKLINPQDSILIASGTTVYYLALLIEDQSPLTVITSSLQVSEILAKNPQIDIIQLGGLVRHSNLSVISKFAEQMLGNFSCSKLFMGADGIDLEQGISATNMLEASLNRVMMSSSQKTIVLADSSKFARRGFSKVCNIGEIDHIITDDRISDTMARQIEDLGIELTVAAIANNS